MKTCSKCLKSKKLEEFYKDNSKSNRIYSCCKSCKKEYKANYYKKNKRKISNKCKEYRLKHLEELKVKSKIWRENNKEKIKEFAINWRFKNKERKKEMDRNYRIKNRDKLNKYLRKYYNENKIFLVARSTKKRKQSRKNNIKIRIRDRLAKRIWDALKNNYKSKPTMELIGCSIEHLKLHLQSQFKKGMTWNNYGFYGWHIDHIRPCCSFDLSKAEEQRKCFHYTNLQPLWAKENLKKGGKYEFQKQNNPS